METVGKKLIRWDDEGHRQFSGGRFSALDQKLRFLAYNRYRQYMVSTGQGGRDFEARLAIWLNQISDEKDQMALAEMAANLAFIGEDEMRSLCTSAFNGPITKWIIDQCGLLVSDINFDSQLTTHRGDLTRYVAATDSFPIHDFYKLTPTVSHSEKFNLKAFWKTQTLSSLAAQMMAEKRCERVVILEDFVGSGEQTQKMIHDWLTIFRKPTLFTPLIACPGSVTCFENLTKIHRHFSFEPVLKIDDSDLLNGSTICGAGTLEAFLQALVTRLHAQVEGDCKAHPPPYSPFGFPPPNGTGCPLVLKGNVPDNALPVIHFKSSSWEPLFPRKPRELT